MAYDIPDDEAEMTPGAGIGLVIIAAILLALASAVVWLFIG